LVSSIYDLDAIKNNIYIDCAWCFYVIAFYQLPWQLQASKEFSAKSPRFFELDEAAKLLFINENGCHNAN
jgi:hypothetical protein